MATEVTPGKEQHKPGIYKHSAGGEFITSEGDEGIVQANALMSPHWMGQWKRIKDVPSRQDLLIMREAQTKKDIAAGMKPETGIPT